MKFEEAIAVTKRGTKVRRGGWPYGKSWVAMRSGYMQGVPANRSTAVDLGIPEGQTIQFSPYHVLMTDVDGSRVLAPWTPSTEDMVTDDWYPVEPDGHDGL